MRRLCFLAPDVHSARHIVSELTLMQVRKRHIHVLAREGVALEDLPEARLAQSSNLIHAMEKGSAVGGVCGALGGLIAMASPVTGLTYGGGLLGYLVFGAGFGAWISGMAGSRIPNSDIEQYRAAIAAGYLLMMVDVQKERIDELREVVMRAHPEVKLKAPGPQRNSGPG